MTKHKHCDHKKCECKGKAQCSLIYSLYCLYLREQNIPEYNKKNFWDQACEDIYHFRWGKTADDQHIVDECRKYVEETIRWPCEIIKIMPPKIKTTMIELVWAPLGFLNMKSVQYTLKTIIYLRLHFLILPWNCSKNIKMWIKWLEYAELIIWKAICLKMVQIMFSRNICFHADGHRG